MFQSDYEEFFATFVTFLDYLLLQGFKDLNPYTEKLLQFCAAFITSIKPEEDMNESVMESELLEDTIYHLLEVHHLYNNIQFIICVYILGTVQY